jgi:signal transduction histidine kinase
VAEWQLEAVEEEEIDWATERLETLASILLDVTRIQAVQMEARCELHDLGALVRRVVARARHKAQILDAGGGAAATSGTRHGAHEISMGLDSHTAGAGQCTDAWECTILMFACADMQRATRSLVYTAAYVSGSKRAWKKRRYFGS